MYFDSCWLYCQHEHEMRLNMCWPNKSHASDDTKCIEHVLTQPLKCQRGHKIHLTMCCPNPYHAWEDTKCASTCVDEDISTCFDQTHLIAATRQNIPQTPYMPARTPYASKHVLTNSLLCHWGHKIQPNHASEYSKCIKTYLNQTLHMPSRTQIISQIVLCHASNDKRCFSTCVEQIPSNASADTNCISTWYHYMCVNECWPNPSHSIVDRKCISTSADRTPTMPSRNNMHLN